MTDQAAALDALVTHASEHLFKMSEAEASVRRADDAWSPKEILGHLIDSASNNHQRFVRAQLQESLEMPGYEQDGWIRVQRYSTERWSEIITLWQAYNRHLSHVIAAMNPGSLKKVCQIGEYDPATLEFLVIDYVDHMRHHLKQIDPALA